MCNFVVRKLNIEIMSKGCFEKADSNSRGLENGFRVNNFFTYFARCVVGNKKFAFWFIGLLMLSCSIVAQTTDVSISMTGVEIPGVVIIGSYSQLIETQGYPNSRFASKVNPINPRCVEECGYVVSPASVVQCEYLVYEAFEYIHVGDSVQLVFMDLRKAHQSIYIKDFCVARTITSDKFIREIGKRGLWNDELSEYKIGKIESHYCSHTKVNSYYLDFAEDPYSSVIFTFYDTFFSKKIWWIEFPVMRIGGIVH